MDASAERRGRDSRQAGMRGDAGRSSTRGLKEAAAKIIVNGIVGKIAAFPGRDS